MSTPKNLAFTANLPASSPGVMSKMTFLKLSGKGVNTGPLFSSPTPTLQVLLGQRWWVPPTAQASPRAPLLEACSLSSPSLTSAYLIFFYLPGPTKLVSFPGSVLSILTRAITCLLLSPLSEDAPFPHLLSASNFLLLPTQSLLRASSQPCPSHETGRV